MIGAASSLRRRTTASARLHFALGDLQGALDSYGKAVKVREGLEPDAAELAMTLDNTGSIYRLQGQFREAFIVVHRAAMIRERRAGTSGSCGGGVVVPTSSGLHCLTGEAVHVLASVGSLLDAATSYNNVGLVLRSLGKRKEALDAFSKCLGIRERYCALGSPELLAVRRNMASVQLDQGEQ